MISIESLIQKINKNAVHLSLGRVNFNSEPLDKVAELASIIKNSKGIVSVSLEDINLSPIDLQKVQLIFESIKFNIKINKLCFSSSHLELASKNILDVLYDCIENKEYLIICRNSLKEDSEGINFIRSLSRTQIKRLEFDFNDIGSRGFRVLRDTTTSLCQSNLNYLSLASNGIGSLHPCGEILLKLLSSNIKHLVLDGNPLGCGTTCEDWEEIFGAMQKNNQLKTLSLSVH